MNLITIILKSLSLATFKLYFKQVKLSLNGIGWQKLIGMYIGHAKLLQSGLTLWNPVELGIKVGQAPLPMVFSRQEY